MKEITLVAELANIPQATAWVDGELEAIGCGMKAQMQIDVAIDELFSNIARYAYPGGKGEATLRFSFDEAERAVMLTFVDRGVPYDPLAKDDPDVSLTADKRAIGGLGIYLVKKTMDDVSYTYTDGQNCLTIRKKI